MADTNKEGLKVARFLMVLASFAPLFVLWAIRGGTPIPDRYLYVGCGVLIVLPNLFLWLRVRTARKLNEHREVAIGSADDHRDHLVVYLFVMLLPLYAVDLNSNRGLWADIMAVGFVIFVFWHLNLHYMNVVFAALGYRIFSVTPPRDENPLSGREAFVVITKRPILSPGERLAVYRVSDTVYFEV
jgi:hypothetical protein